MDVAKIKQKAKAMVDAAKIKAKAMVDKAKEKSIGKKNSKEIVGAAKEKAKAIVDAVKTKAKAIVDKAKEKAMAHTGLEIEKVTQRGGIYIANINNKKDDRIVPPNLKEYVLPMTTPFAMEMIASKFILPKKGILKSLDLSNGFYEIGACGIIGNVISKIQELHTLKLSNANINDKALLTLNEGFRNVGKKTNSIETLDLSKNQIEGENVFSVLGHLKTLTSLDLSSNKIGDKGAAALAEALPSMTGLTELNLNSNKIGDEGATALAQVLPYLKKLKRINLSNNMIHYEGVNELNNIINEGLTTNEDPIFEYNDEGSGVMRNQTSPPSLIETLDLSNNYILFQNIDSLHDKIISTGQIVETPQYAIVRQQKQADAADDQVGGEVNGGGKKSKKYK
jgi:hypothetical protein